MKQKLTGLLRYLLGFALALWLIHLVVKSSGADLRKEFQECQQSYIVLAFMLYGVGLALGSFRWARLLEVQGVSLTAYQAIRLTMLGAFFNVLAPGGVGGDGAKIIYLTPMAGSRTAEAILSILVDRIVGLLGLFVVAIGAVIAHWEFLGRAPDPIRIAVFSVLEAALCGFLATGVAMFHDVFLKVRLARSLLEWLASRAPARLVEIVTRIGGALVTYRSRPGVVALALTVSVVIHCSTALAVTCIGMGFHAAVLGLRDYFLATQIANTVSVLPIFPGGLGGRDVILSMFFKAAGEGPKAGVIPTVLSMLVILWSLVGGIFFLLDGRLTPTALRAQTRPGRAPGA